ncbi:heterokaryon incompatibility protein-domain-containing protein [Boeremia exigua]|uniref:heterokaryon incompatibility protein-domain-containing protein n=1 Tax=Boeremia exigua TaxID=749465 RepID=UPI001E8ED91C|nr:heterokaryon incompatibility protein-domain-containing protein [Boeremia exigua]KAH6629718.1 heterokaryon incompatibility protein-domain-containing protein [Boeremia exigua]
MGLPPPTSIFERTGYAIGVAIASIKTEGWLKRYGISRIDHWKATLCVTCAKALRFNGSRILHDLDETIEQSLETCPLCAIAEFFCSLHQNNFERVTLNLVENPGMKCRLSLRFTTGSYVKTEVIEGAKIKYSPLSSHKFSAPAPSTLSSESIGFLKQQLQTCLKRHPECLSASNVPPSRLLQVELTANSIQDPNSTIHLVDGSAAVGGSYVTLSHCWGKANFKQLTSTTEFELRAGLTSQALPKTFQDAIYVCQQLGQQYLWIDSLCIRQDDPEDWDREAAKMHLVYANAVFNIAATGAANSSVGLSFQRNPLAHQPFCVHTGTGGHDRWLFLPDWSDHTILESPLNRRAWVSQERFLSNRIMHFTTAGLYWECRRSRASDLRPTHGPLGGWFNFSSFSALRVLLDYFSFRGKSIASLNRKES